MYRLGGVIITEAHTYLEQFYCSPDGTITTSSYAVSPVACALNRLYARLNDWIFFSISEHTVGLAFELGQRVQIVL